MRQSSLPKRASLLCRALPLFLLMAAFLWWTQREYFVTSSLKGAFSDSIRAAVESSIISDNNNNNTSKNVIQAPLVRGAAANDFWSGNNTNESKTFFRFMSNATTHDSNKLKNTKKNGPSHVRFHRWESENGIDIKPLWHCMHGMTPPDAPYTRYGPFPAFIDPRGNLLVSMKVFPRRPRTIMSRATVILPFIQEALQLFRELPNGQDIYPFLSMALNENGLPVIFDLADYVGCLEHNYNYTLPGENNVSTTTSVPMFTLSSSPSCGYGFPIPSYTTIQLAKKHAEDWNDSFNKSESEYPWNTKAKKAVWRGTASGSHKFRTSPLDIPRIYLNFLAKNHSDIMDVAHACWKRCDIRWYWKHLVREGNFTAIETFQSYRAVLDLDGNSWSERFPKLLCQNSVVIRIDPEQIDYFWPTLQAGVHYVAANFSNVVSVVQDVVSDSRQREMQRIVANAHEWCRQRMVVQPIQLDILSVLDGYAQELYKADPNWSRHMTQLRDFDFAFTNNTRVNL